MKIFLIYFTQRGKETCESIREALAGAGHCCESSDGRGLPRGLSSWTEKAFTSGEALIFVSAAGIAVRAIAPFIRSKTTDPAVIVLDEQGRFVISLLSGHMGGANRLAGAVAEVTGGVSVVTTATDINGLFAVDQWAKEQGLYIWDMKLAKAVAASLLRQETVGFCCQIPLEGQLPKGLKSVVPTERAGPQGSPPQLGICVAIRREERQPFSKTLWLTPKRLVLGIGCRRGIGAEQIRQAAEAALAEKGLALGMVWAVASIDLKENEEGLIEFAGSLGVPFITYSAQRLLEAEYSQGFTASGFVQSVTGVDNVCERAAVLHAAQGRETAKVSLLVPKRAENGVTIGAAMDMEGLLCRI